MQANKYYQESFEASNTLSPLALAYVGDAVFELMVRTNVLSDTHHARKMSEKTCRAVNHHEQSLLYEKWYAYANDEEKAVLRRGKNAHSRPPRGGDAKAYRLATAIEALAGWLYLRGEEERLRCFFAFSESQGEHL